MRKPSSRRTSAVGHALTLTRLAPGVASKRVAELATATPVRAFAMFVSMVSEKSIVFAQAYAHSLTAVGLAQLSFLRLASGSMTPRGVMGASQETTSLMVRSGNEIARAALAPLARRVRLNAQ